MCSTSATWHDETNPDRLIAALQFRADNRSLRRLACAFARAAWPWFVDERSRYAVEVAERYVAQTAAHGELVAAEALARAAFGRVPALDSRADRVRWFATRCAANAANTRAHTSTTSADWFAATLACQALAQALLEGADTDPAALLCAIVRAEFPELPDTPYD